MSFLVFKHFCAPAPPELFLCRKSRIAELQVYREDVHHMMISLADGEDARARCIVSTTSRNIWLPWFYPCPPPNGSFFGIYFLAHSVSQVMAGTLLHLNLANWLIIVERPRAAQSG